MSREEARERWRRQVRAAIRAHGHHVTLVQGGVSPRFAYTLGLSEAAGHELVLAGAAPLGAEEVARVVDHAAHETREGTLAAGGAVEVAGIGTFRAGEVHATWVAEMLLGAFTLYGSSGVPAVQLVPEEAIRTIDVPDLSQPWDPGREPVWRWLREPWELAVPDTSVAVTDLDALRGAPVTEAARWEDDQWELFAGAGPDVPKDEVRAVPLATLVGHDPSLEPVTRLEVGRAMRREPSGPWKPWDDQGQDD